MKYFSKQDGAGQKGSSWKPPASLGMINVSFVLTLVPDLYIILYLLGLSAGVPGCSGTVTPILVNLGFTSVPVVTPAKFLITLNFLSEEASGVFVTEVTFVPGLYLPVFQTLSAGQFVTADGCWKQS